MLWPWRNLLRAVAALGCATTGVLAQGPSPSSAPPAAELSEEKARRERELRAVEDAAAANAAARLQLDGEIAELRTDRAKLAAALVATTERARVAEDRMAGVEGRLDTLLGSEGAIRRSLGARRDFIAEVLATLQRMGRRPPPAILAQPEDILAAVRASMLLGAVVPWQRWGIPEVVARRAGAKAFFKGGWRPGLTHQVALIERGRSRIALAVMTSDGPGIGYDQDTIAGIARRVLLPTPRSG